MSIQILNYNANIATKSLVASFDIIVGCWMIRDLKLFEKNGKKWVIMPSKSVKHEDGTWGTPIPYCELTSKDTWYKMQSDIMRELDRVKSPSKIFSDSNFSDEYYPNSNIKQQQPQQIPASELEGCPF